MLHANKQMWSAIKVQDLNASMTAFIHTPPHNPAESHRIAQIRMMQTDTVTQLIIGFISIIMYVGSLNGWVCADSLDF